MDRPQAVLVGKHVSPSLTLNTGAPQGCVISPLLYSLYTYDCVATSSSTNIIKFADDTAVVSLEEIKNLETWCQDNNLLLNISKTNSDSGLQYKTYCTRVLPAPHHHWVPSGESGQFPVPRCSCHARSVMVLSRQHPGEEGPAVSLPSQAPKGLPSKVLKTFYTFTTDSILTGSVTAWFGNSTMQDRKTLQRVVRSAERSIRAKFPHLVLDQSHPNNGLFSML
ncbi:hypothetical protein QTP70_001328, partial [Hemibagrus guttatus]